MKTPDRYDLWKKEEYTYEMACGFMPNIRAYIHEENASAPAVLVVPGGGYCNVSNTEGEIIAEKYYEQGYQAFVLTYTTNLLCNAPLKIQPLKDISRAVCMIRERAKAFKVKENKIYLCGFSAGAHLCGTLCVHYMDMQDETYAGIDNRPDGAILSYPVITAGQFAHQDSFRALLGADIYKEEGASYEGLFDCHTTREALAYMSLENYVTEDTPPCFLWHTATDELVPMENSLLFARKLRECGVPFAYHLYSAGPHGLSLANEQVAEGNYGGEYTMEQQMAIRKAWEEGALEPETADKFEQFDRWLKELLAGRAGERREPNYEVMTWIDLAIAWLKNMEQLEQMF